MWLVTTPQLKQIKQIKLLIFKIQTFMETKKEFAPEQLENIIMLGSIGKTLSDVAKMLGTTPDKLRDERKLNKDLDDALIRSESNFNEYALSKLYELAMSGKNLKLSIEVYKSLSKENICKQQDKNRKL